MEIKKTKRNPAWQRDELILALDLYFNINPSEINSNNQKIIELSKILNELPIFEDRLNTEKFRNPNSVSMKLNNLRRLDPNYTGKGLERGGKLEEEIWNEFANDRDELHKVANRIKNGLGTIKNEPNSNIEDDEKEFPEGKVLYRMHRQRERNQKMIENFKQKALESGKLYCQVCGFDFFKTYGELGKGFIECHHTIPVSSYEENQQTRMKDLALVCSNCHRMLHRRRPWLTISELSNILAK